MFGKDEEIWKEAIIVLRTQSYRVFRPNIRQIDPKFSINDLIDNLQMEYTY